MTQLQAAWLASWKAPWGLERGRRWGDPAWALAAIAQAWLLGGREGRWPRGSWAAKRPGGPHLTAYPETFEPAPAPEWISLLRHGSPRIPPNQRGRGERDLVAHCWDALLEGEGAPWMALGTVLFDRKTRTRWVPVLGAVDPTGTLHLPPFLEALIPPWMYRLPEGWWACLLACTDASGRLLPEGPPPQDFPRPLLDLDGQALLDPLLLHHPPATWTPSQRERWAARLSEDTWMVDPRLRAWTRGLGLAPDALKAVVPPSLALGDPARGSASAALANPATITLPGPDAPCGYPPCPVPAHPCADPFHWLRQGLQAEEPEAALNAFRWAHGHFKRLRSASWIRRVAREATQAALTWGDPPQAATWRTLRGPEEGPAQILEEARFLAARGDWEQAATMARKTTATHPELAAGWRLLAQCVLLLDRPHLLDETLCQRAPGEVRDMLAAVRDGRSLTLENPEPHSRLLWAFQAARRTPATAAAFWQAWERCPDRPLRLETGLRLLEQHPGQRTLPRLQALRRLADRSGSTNLQVRLQALCPSPGRTCEPDPRRMLEDWLGERKEPTWLLWGDPARPDRLGTGFPPPPQVIRAFHPQGGLEPLQAGGVTWWGQALSWEGGLVGSVLTIVPAGSPLQPQSGVQLLAPWLARLAPAQKTKAPPPMQRLLTDGSEPMASMLAELARVAPSDLPVLILGPTGSGKELTAQEIHARSGRQGPFRPINCSEYSETLLESELFGHAKGAFTGADRERQGLIESAEGGTLFLDEVADLSPRLQSLFLRVLQEKEIRRVGTDRARRVDVRFLAATHRPLEQMAAAGTFRKDLYYRLQGAVLTLPSLRERQHEFPSLLPQLTARVAQETGLPPPQLAPGLASALARLPWPGNVRELRHALERALLRCTDGVLKASHFPELAAPPQPAREWNDATRAFQHRLLLTTLKQHRFQITDAAQSLGLTRPALYTAAKRLGLDLLAERKRWDPADR